MLLGKDSSALARKIIVTKGIRQVSCTLEGAMFLLKFFGPTYDVLVRRDLIELTRKAIDYEGNTAAMQSRNTLFEERSATVSRVDSGVGHCTVRVTVLLSTPAKLAVTLI